MRSSKCRPVESGMGYSLPWNARHTDETLGTPANALGQFPDPTADPGGDRVLTYAETNGDFALLQSLRAHPQDRPIFTVQPRQAIHHDPLALLPNQSIELVWRGIDW